ncbi:MAG TPA: class I SAM-dependent methyltransferase [Planctomycetaceae bacterium]|jgi:cyclopropane fatty-acyl-phospholipid synthase-like methyltransferase|nr:class I SAM-dependent methyltransferase [Planctomycetaceae bacterium]
MTAIPNRGTFEAIYAGQAPWDIGRPQKVFIDAANQIKGALLDAGCGTGENALFFSGRGCDVTGIDFLDVPIGHAKRKAAERGLKATFLVKDALTLANWSTRFENVIDSGLFHVFSDEGRRRYVDGLAAVLKPGGRLFLLCFSDDEPGTQGPRRVPKHELQAAFAKGWKIESIVPARFETRPDLKDLTFSEGGPKAWFAIVRRAD